jgi:hypothetical protein
MNSKQQHTAAPGDHSFQAQGSRVTFTALPNWIKGRLTPFEFCLLWTMQSHYPMIFPSLNLLAKESGMSRRKVILVMADLEAKGLVEKRLAFFDDGRQASSRYRLTVWDAKWLDQVRQEQEGAGDPWGQALPVGMVQGVHLQAAPARVHGMHPQGGRSTVHPMHSRGARRAPEEDQEKNNKPKSKEPPSIPPLGGSLPSVAGVGRLDVDESVSEQPRPRSGLQQPREAAFDASSGHPCPPAPQNGPPGPQNGQQPQPAPLEQPAAQQKAPPKLKDPYSARHLPEHAVPNDLLPVQQLLREWWSVKARGRSEAAFNRACSLLRRHNRAEQEQILEKAVIGGYQGLHEPAPSASGRGPAAKPSLTQELRSMGLIQ